MLTPAQKIAAYQYALYSLALKPRSICVKLRLWLLDNINDEAIFNQEIRILFPEFYAYEPKGAFLYWWPLDESGRLIRIDVLTKAIANVKL
jgi:hypothetical protein